MSVKPLLDVFRDYISSRDEEIVCDWFADFDWSVPERSLKPNTLAAIEELPDVLNHCGKAELPLAERFVAMRDQLHWLQSYTADDFGQYMVDHYGFVELIGTRGHYPSDEIAAGLVFFGKGIEYPEHWHDSHAGYYPLTGTGLWSQSDEGYLVKKPGEFVFHEPHERHSLKAPEYPLLAVWMWRGGNLAEKGNY